MSGTVVTIFLEILVASSSSSLLTKDILLDFCDLLFTIFMFLWGTTGKLELEVEVVELIVELFLFHNCNRSRWFTAVSRWCLLTFTLLN